MFQSSSKGVDVNFNDVDQMPESDRFMGQNHSYTGYHCTNNGFGSYGMGKKSENDVYAFVDDGGNIRVFNAAGTEATWIYNSASSLFEQGGRSDELGFVHIPGHPNQYLMIASHTSSQYPSGESIYLVDLDGNDYGETITPSDLTISLIGAHDYPVGTYSTRCGEGEGYLTSPDAIAISHYDYTNEQYVLYHLGLHSTLGFGLHKTTIDFSTFDPSADELPKLVFPPHPSTKPSVYMDDFPSLAPGSSYYSEMELASNQRALAVSDGNVISFIFLDANGAVSGDASVDISNSISGVVITGLEFTYESDRLYFSTLDDHTAGGTQRALYYVDVDAANNSIGTFAKGTNSIDGTVAFRASQLEMGRDARIYAVNNNGTKLVAFDDNTSTVDLSALTFHNSATIPLPESYGSNGCAEYEFYTLPDQVDGFNPLMHATKELKTHSYAGSPKDPANNWQIIAQDISDPYNYYTGTTGTSADGNDLDGLASWTFDPAKTYKIFEVHKPGYVPFKPVSDYFYSWQSGTGVPPTFKFVNRECENKCNLVDDMVAYLHFQETSGSSVGNVMGTNAIVVESSTGNQLTGSTVIGYTSSNNVRVVNGVLSPEGDNSNALLLTEDLPLKTSGNAHLEIPNYSDLEVGGTDFAIDFEIDFDYLDCPNEEVLLKKCSQSSGADQTGWEVSLQHDHDYDYVDITIEFFKDRNVPSLTKEYSKTYRINEGTGSGEVVISKTTDNFYHLAFVRHDDRTGGDDDKVLFYFDGIKQTEHVTAPAVSSDVLDFEGNDFSSTGNLIILPDPIKCKIDEFSVYNRSITKLEIEAIVADGKCWDYVRFEEQDPQEVCFPGGGGFTERGMDIFNGSMYNKEFVWALAPRESGTQLAFARYAGDKVYSTAAGPIDYSPNSEILTIPAGSSNYEAVQIRCAQTGNTAKSIYQVTVMATSAMINEPCMCTNGLSESAFTGAPNDENDGEMLTSIEENTNMPMSGVDGIKLYPNPATHELILEVSKPIEGAGIVSIQGQQMGLIDALAIGANAINISSLPKGSYFIQIRFADEVKTLPFIKE